jgi:uncharacterized protein DUF6174
VRSRPAVRAAAAVVALGTASCGGSLSPSQIRGERSQLTVARGRWAAQGPDSYRYRFQYLCFCPTSQIAPVEIQVRLGRVVAVLDPASGRPALPDARRPAPTVEDLFAVIDEAIARPVDWIDVQYEPVLGYPMVIRVDPNTRTTDEEISYFAGSLTPLP